MGLFPGPAVVAEPVALGHVDVQTLPVERGRTRLTAQQAAPCSMGVEQQLESENFDKLRH